ncbi:uncharacterized protein [Henckelia pumila]|uniref:uncharacterized protein n=1 Tax=Henckelia pumila TaxID=405737 RepID=UPI003C6E5EC0
MTSSSRLKMAMKAVMRHERAKNSVRAAASVRGNGFGAKNSVREEASVRGNKVGFVEGVVYAPIEDGYKSSFEARTCQKFCERRSICRGEQSWFHCFFRGSYPVRHVLPLYWLVRK